MNTREKFNVPEEDIRDFTRENSCWIIKNETYNFIDTFLVKGDGECHNVIVQRESDKKYFEFGWCYDDGNYYYEPEWCEVKPQVITKTIYKWYE
jgi:hypothetical protein